jgi:outer membrane lipoprotein-sorting protein
MSHSVVQKGFMFVKITRTVPFLLSLIVSLSGCLSARIPVKANYVGGTVVTTLSSNISLSYAAPGRSLSGNGFLMFKKPDKMRVVLLSPFGSVLQEIYVSGELITIIDSGNGIAFTGTHTDLPAKGDFSGWRYINWLIDIDPSDPSRRTGAVQRINRFGESEKADFENGMLISKRTEEAGFVRYGGYADVHGAPFPSNIRYETAARETFTITLEEPEINVTLADSAFIPDLSKLRVYPLSVLK